MKLTTILFLILALGAGLNLYGQTKTAPSPSPTPSGSMEIIRTELATKTTRVTGISAQTERQLETAAKLMQDGKHEESIAAHSNIIKTHPSIMLAYNNRG